MSGRAMKLPVLLICLSYFLTASAWPYHCRACKPHPPRPCPPCQKKHLEHEDTSLSAEDKLPVDNDISQEDELSVENERSVSEELSMEDDLSVEYSEEDLSDDSKVNVGGNSSSQEDDWLKPLFRRRYNDPDDPDAPYYPVKPFPYPSLIYRIPPNETKPDLQDNPEPCTESYWPFPPRTQGPNVDEKTVKNAASVATTTEIPSTVRPTSESTSTVRTQTERVTRKTRHRHPSKHKHPRQNTSQRRERETKQQDIPTIKFSQES